MDLPADSHVHSEWSWDTGGPRSSARGTMQRTCERALKIGLPAVVFTEHLDFDGWEIGPQDTIDAIRHLITPEGILDVPTLDVAGYLDSIDRCRRQFPSLQILTGRRVRAAASVRHAGGGAARSVRARPGQRLAAHPAERCAAQ